MPVIAIAESPVRPATKKRPAAAPKHKAAKTARVAQTLVDIEDNYKHHGVPMTDHLGETIYVRGTAGPPPSCFITPGHDRAWTVVLRTTSADKAQVLEVTRSIVPPTTSDTVFMEVVKDVIKTLGPLVHALRFCPTVKALVPSVLDDIRVHAQNARTQVLQERGFLD